MVLLAVVTAGAVSRHPLGLSEAFVEMVNRGPGSRTAHEFVAAFRSPLLAVLAFAALYGALIGFFSFHSVGRRLESS